MKTMKIRIEFTEEALGMTPSNSEVLADWIASKAPDAKSMKEEIESVGTVGMEERMMTVFPKTEEGEPFFWDYQIKGFFKDACGHMRKANGSACSKLKAYKKEIGGLIFPYPRQIIINKGVDEKTLIIGDCQRSLRASTPLGERICLAMSETVPAGSYMDLEITLLKDELEAMVKECLDYGKFYGISGWRSSGKGRFEWVELEKTEKEELDLNKQPRKRKAEQ